MLDAFAPASTGALAVLLVCLILVLAFEFSNGFHDTANAVATVIYTNALNPMAAVIWSGLMNFAGVMLGGLAVAYTLIELIPADVLIPPDGNPTLALLFSLTSAALLWNVGTWYFGLPCSSSHAIIGAILGIAIVHALAEHTPLATAMDWRQIWKVGEALIFSPLAGLILAGLLFRLLRRWLPDPHLYTPPEPGQPPVAWLRALLILTSTGVSFAHGLNDGQKNIGLIMLTIIGLTPLQHAINLDYPAARLPQLREATARLDELLRGQPAQQESPVSATLASAHYLHQVFSRVDTMRDIPPAERRQVRSAIYQIDELIKLRLRNQQGDAQQRLWLQQSRILLLPLVQYVPAWVRLLSAACLGLGTMIGYRRIIHTLGERIGTTPLTPAQGACTELAGAGLITAAAKFGLPVSTTHIIASGIAGTMISQGTQVQSGVLRQIALAWILTLPVTLVLAACLFYGLS